MSSALKLAADFESGVEPETLGYVALGTGGYWTDAQTLRNEASFLAAVEALRATPSPLEFTAEFLEEQKENFIRHSKARIDANELSEQLEAIFGMLDRGQHLSVITGPPGAAKSTIASLWARIVRSKYQEIPILILAQEKTALQRLREKIDIDDSSAWIMEEALNKTAPWPRGAAIIVDEAGLFGTEIMLKLLQRAQSIGAAKVILIGDDKQLASDAPGSPFRWLCEQQSTDAIILQHSFRQKNLWLREAVQALYQDQINEALRLMPCHFMGVEDMLPAIQETLREAMPENTLIIVHGSPYMLHHLPNVLPGFRILSLAEAQGLAIDRVVLVLGQAINRAEFLVGSSRQRHELDVFIDTAVYNDAAQFAATIQPYPKNLMALDVLAADDLKGLAGC